MTIDTFRSQLLAKVGISTAISKIMLQLLSKSQLSRIFETVFTKIFIVHCLHLQQGRMTPAKCDS